MATIETCFDELACYSENIVELGVAERKFSSPFCPKSVSDSLGKTDSVIGDDGVSEANVETCGDKLACYNGCLIDTASPLFRRGCNDHYTTK